ncbi:MAG: GNAT family N-acetyltransferase [Dehalococcoidales bacterium]
MNYTIKTADIKDKPLIYSMLQNYLRDFTQFETIPLNESGEYEYQYLKYYWTEHTRFPYLFYCGEDATGLALVRKEEQFFSMAEFTILPNFRRKGLGTACATEVIHKHPGKWHIEYNINNTAGKKFWNKLIPGMVGTHFQKRPAEEENREYLEFVIGEK